ncbi:MAG TPA: PqqD family peptide modification chaperone [Pyrinomonadaceae bacterium]|jgi:hypothetical protein
MPREARYRVNVPKVTSEIIDGEAIMINLESGSYYNLNPAGTDIWDGVEKGLTFSGIVAALARRYDCERPALEKSVLALLEQLKEEDLIREEQAEGAGDAQSALTQQTAPDAPGQKFVEPVLQKYTDMQDLIMLDPIHEVDEQGWPRAKSEPAA